MTLESPDGGDPVLGKDAALKFAQMCCAVQAGKASFDGAAAVDMTMGVLRQVDKFVSPELRGLKWLS